MGNLDRIGYLIGKGADIHAKTKYDKTTLHLAAENGRKDVVEYLIGKGADIHAKNNDN